MPSLLFVSPFCHLDFTSGAAVSMRDLLLSLAERGWQCDTLCGSHLDAPAATMGSVLAAHGLAAQTCRYDGAPASFAVLRMVDGGVNTSIYEPRQWSVPPAIEEGYPFLQLLDRFLLKRRPDVLLTYGGGWLGRGLMVVARRHAIPVVFWLRNTEYRHRDLFETAAGALVPCRFTARHYRESLGLNCRPIHSPIRLERVLCGQRQPRFATFVGPRPDKGVFYFARIASELGRLRPDIPMLVVVGRADERRLDETGLDLRGLPNMHIMPATPDPRRFFAVTRVLLAPSLWQETFLRIGAEGMINGIPSLASRLGGIPETLGGSGFLFDIAPHHRPDSMRLPEASEVTPWIQMLQRLWDDEGFYHEQCERSVVESSRFRPEVLMPQYEDYLQQIIRTFRPARIAPRRLEEDLAGLQRFFSQPLALERFAAVGNASDHIGPV